MPRVGHLPKNTRMTCGSPVTDSLGTQGALRSLSTLLCLTHRDRGCSSASLPQQCWGPPPVGKNPQSWVSSHSNLSFRTLSAPHNGPGDHSRQPPPPVSTLLGNGLFLPLLGVGWGHLQEGPVLVGISDPWISAFRQIGNLSTGRGQGAATRKTRSGDRRQGPPGP